MIKKVLIFAVAVLSAFALMGCKTTKVSPDGEYDDITKKCKLELTYQDKDFFNEGIGEATLAKSTDGDTANFILKKGSTGITVRFYGIDTPESTGDVEKWGKAASIFTKKKLESAKEIVLEASETPAVKDSYGVRYLAYVWYRCAETEDFKNLNLEIVENGYSTNKCIPTPAYKYYSSFKKAEDFAKKYELRVHGNSVDQYYSSEPAQITIKEFRDNVEKYYNAETGSGAKIRIEAYISDLRMSSGGSPTYTFVAQQVIDGVIYSIDIYAGYSSSQVAQHMMIGTKYVITGSIQEHGGSFQISGITYVPLQRGGDYLTSLQKDYYMTFDTNKTYISPYGSSLLTDAVIIGASVEDNILTLSATAYVKSKDGNKGPYEYTFKVPAPENVDCEQLVGRRFSTTGYQEVKDSKIINVLSYSNINFR